MGKANKNIELNEMVIDEHDAGLILFDKYEKEFEDVIKKCTTIDHYGLDYDIDHNGKILFYIPVLTFSSDWDIDKESGIEDQIREIKEKILAFLNKNAELKNFMDTKSIDIYHRKNEQGNESDWIAVYLTTKDGIELREKNFYSFISLMKYMNDFLLKLN